MHRVDPSDGVDAAISSASEYGRTDVVKLLLQDPRVDPSAEDSNAIRWGSDKGHFTVVKLLLADARVNPSARNNAALICASEYGHFVVVKLLLQDSRVDPSNLQVIMDLSFQHLKTDMQILSSCSFKILEFIHWIMINRLRGNLCGFQKWSPRYCWNAQVLYYLQVYPLIRHLKAISLSSHFQKV